MLEKDYMIPQHSANSCWQMQEEDLTALNLVLEPFSRDQALPLPVCLGLIQYEPFQRDEQQGLQR